MRFVPLALALAAVAIAANVYGARPGRDRRAAAVSASGSSSLVVTLGETTTLFHGNETDPPSDSAYGQYKAFPGVGRIDSNTLLAAYYAGASHAVETSRILVNRSTNNGRSWLQKGPVNTAGYEVEIERTTTHELAGSSITKLASGRVGTIYQRVDIDHSLGYPERQVEYRYSDDSGTTWSSAAVFPALGTQHTSCGCGPIIQLDANTLLTPVYSRDLGEGRYTSRMIRSTNGGTSWAELSIIAQTAEAAGYRQYEEPYCRKLADNRILCLIRDDLTTSIYKFYSSDDGATWTSEALAFPGYGKTPFVQLTNGALIATTRDPVLPYRGHIYVSPDSGATWQGPTALPSTVHGLYAYADIVEHETNVAGIFHSQERTDNVNRTFLRYTQVGVNATPATTYRNTTSLRWPAANGAGVAYGTTAYLDGATKFTLEFWYQNIAAFVGGTQGILSKDGTNQRHLNVYFTSTDMDLRVHVNSPRTEGFNFCTIDGTTYFQGGAGGTWYQVIAVYDGAGADNAARLKLYVNGAAATCTFTGTIPAAMTTPTVAQATYVGSSGAPASTSYRDGYLQHLRLWAGVAATSGQVATMYGGRVPQSTATLTTALGSAPKFEIRGEGADATTAATDTQAFLAAPTITGAITVPATSEEISP